MSCVDRENSLLCRPRINIGIRLTMITKAFSLKYVEIYFHRTSLSHGTYLYCCGGMTAGGFPNTRREFERVIPRSYGDNVAGSGVVQETFMSDMALTENM